MYASNEDEFNREEDNDWVFLRQTPPATTILHGAVNLADDEQSNSGSSSSSSSSSSKSDRSDSTSSVSSIESEHVHSDDQENHVLIEEPVLASQTIEDNNHSLSTGEIKEEVSPSEQVIKHTNESETTPVINEYDLLNNGQESGNETVELSNNLRRRTGANVQQLAIIEPNQATSEDLSPMIHYNRPRRDRKDIFYVFLILLLVGILIFGRIILPQRSMIKKLTEELKKTNQRLDEIRIVSIEEMEHKLSKQFEEKFQKLLAQKMTEVEQEKFSLILQISELYQIINLTQQNMTNTIHQLSDKNQQLQEQVTVLEQRLQTAEEQNSKEKEICPEGTDCTKVSVPTLDVLLRHIMKQTASIAEDTSENLSGLFEQLSSSLSDLVDHGHEYVEDGKRRLSDLAGSETAEQVQTTLRRGVENLSSSLRKAQSTYVNWLRTRAQQREQARMEQAEQDNEEKPARKPWRWTFQRSHDREQMRHQTPVTKKHAANREYSCHSKCQFPVNHICTMKNWMEKLFRP